MPALIPMLLGYWREVLIAALLAGLLWYRGEALSCQGAREADRAKAEQAKAQALQDAQRRSDAIIAEQATALAATAAKVNTVKERIISVPTTTTCAGSPAVRAATDGLRDILGAGGGDPKAERKPDDPMH